MRMEDSWVSFAIQCCARENQSEFLKVVKLIIVFKLTVMSYHLTKMLVPALLLTC